MTQEEKQLLLIDLCARLPYGVIVDYKENEFEFPHWKITTIYPDTFDGWIGYDKRVGAGSESGSRPFKIGDVKPYLRPMSSMTDEEASEMFRLMFPDHNLIRVEIEKDRVRFAHTDKNSAFYHMTLFFNKIYSLEQLDWYNNNMFDYRGLIPMGIALEAPEGMYKTE